MNRRPTSRLSPCARTAGGRAPCIVIINIHCNHARPPPPPPHPPFSAGNHMKTHLKCGIAALGSLVVAVTLYSHVQEMPKRGESPRSYVGVLPAEGLYPDRVAEAALRLRFSMTVRDLHNVSGVTFKAEPWLVDNGATVTVTWKKVPNPSISEPFDWVATSLLPLGS